MGTTLRGAVWTLYDEQDGSSLVEYLLLVVLIVTAAIAGMTFLGAVSDTRMNNTGLQPG